MTGRFWNEVLPFGVLACSDFALQHHQWQDGDHDVVHQYEAGSEVNAN
jgi:hypothetical protein